MKKTFLEWLTAVGIKEYKCLPHHVYTDVDYEFAVQCSYERTHNSLEEFLKGE